MRRSWLILSSIFLLQGCHVQDASQPVVDKVNEELVRGKQLISAYGCLECHYISKSGAVANWLGPPLTAWQRRNFIAGRYANNKSNLIRWIMIPDTLAPGSAMPNLKVKEEEAELMATYLMSLR